MIEGLTPVQKVLLLQLHLRALDGRSPNPILGDAASVELAEKIDKDWPLIPRSVVLVHAVRAVTLDNAVRRFVARHPDAVVLDLGCGLDTRARRCAPPAGVDWYDVDFPEVTRLRERFLPGLSHPVGADLTTSGWLDDIPGDRPAMVVSDGLMALLPGPAFVALTRTVTAHLSTGEIAFNAYTPFALRAGRRAPQALRIPVAGDGFVDPHEPESWGARLTLLEELLLARAPEIARWPQPLRAVARLTALSTRLSRAGDRVVRYVF